MLGLVLRYHGLGTYVWYYDLVISTMALVLDAKRQLVLRTDRAWYLSCLSRLIGTS
jgi:hypothetical protein